MPPVIATSGWKPLKTAPEALAAKVDGRLATLKNTVASSLATVDLPSGMGRAQMRSVIQSPNRFHIEVLRLGTRRYEEVRKTTFELDRGTFRAMLDEGWVRRPLAEYGQTSKAALESFGTKFDDALFRGVRGAKPLRSLVAAAKRAKWRVAVEGNPRLVPPSVRLRLSAPNGKKQFAINVDERRNLVTQIAVNDTSSGKTPLRILWSCAWGIKPTPLTPEEIEKFDPGRFDLGMGGKG